MAYNPQHPPTNSVSLLFLIVLLVMTHFSIFAAREIRTTPKNSDMIKPDGLIDRDGSVLIPGVGRFMVPSLGRIKGKIDDSQGFGGIVRPFITGGDSLLISNNEVKATEPSGSTSSTPTSPSSYHPRVKISESLSPSSYHPKVKVTEPSSGTSSSLTSPRINHHEVEISEHATSPSSYHPGVKGLKT